MLLAGFLILAPLVPVAMPRVGQPVAVVLPSPAGAEGGLDIVLRGGGRILAAPDGGRVVVAVFDQPGFLRRLWREGAWIALDAGAFRACARLFV